MGIKEEFEKAYLTAPYGKEGDMNHLETALWALEWTLERCYKELMSKKRPKSAHIIRQLAKELDQ